MINRLISRCSPSWRIILVTWEAESGIPILQIRGHFKRNDQRMHDIPSLRMTYGTDGIPGKVTVDWELFSEQIKRVPATATNPAGPLPTFLTTDDNVHKWTGYLKNYQLPTVQEVTIAGSLGLKNRRSFAAQAAAGAQAKVKEVIVRNATAKTSG